MSNIAFSASIDTISVGGINCRFQPSPLGTEIAAPNVFSGKKPFRFAEHKLLPVPVIGEPIIPILPCLTSGVRTYIAKSNPNVFISKLQPVVSGDVTVIEGTERPIIIGPFTEDQVFIGLKTKAK